MSINREPTALISALGLFLSAIAKCAVLLGVVAWDADQLASVSLVIDSMLVVLGALFIRSRVTPTASPSLPENAAVTLPDGTAATVTKT